MIEVLAILVVDS